jgi:hypothetical protein
MVHVACKELLITFAKNQIYEYGGLLKLKLALYFMETTRETLYLYK